MQKKRFIPILLAVLCGILCLFVLYRGENAGLSDNGDYIRVFLVSNISFIEPENNSYIFRQHYTMTVEGDTFFEQVHSLFRSSEKNFYKSPHLGIIKLSKFLNYLDNRVANRPVTCYNIFWLAVIYAAMFAFGVFHLIFRGRTWQQQLLIFICIAFFFCDAGYILYFNSFYGEALQYVTLFILFGLLLHLIKFPKNYVRLSCFYAVLYLFAGSKLLNVPYAIIIALSMLLLTLREKSQRFKYFIMLMTVLSIGLSIGLYTNIPTWMRRDTDYQSVFYGILKQSKTPERDLEALGLNPEYAVLKNTTAYRLEYPIDIKSTAFEEGFYNRISKGKILAFYLRHPLRFIQKLAIAVENSGEIRPSYLGSSTIFRVGQTQKWSSWSKIRVHTNFLYAPSVILPALFFISILCAAALMSAICKKEINQIITRGFLLLLPCGLWINLVLQIIGNGEGDLGKHMFLFIHLLDLSLIAALVWIASKVKTIDLKIKRSLMYAAVLAALLILCPKPPAKKIAFGTYNNKPLLWDIVYEFDNGAKLLITHNIIDNWVFDDKGEYGSNLWEESQIRKRLNGVFLDGFSENERQWIRQFRHPVILSEPNRAKAESGDHPHLWSPIPSQCADLWQTSFLHDSQDFVSLPSIDMVTQVSRRLGSAFWLTTPYCGEKSMVREVEKNGFILRRDANRTSGVRPVILLKPPEH